MKQYQHPESHQIIHYIADRIRPSDISFSFFNEPHIYISDPKKIVFKESQQNVGGGTQKSIKSLWQMV